MEVSSSHQMYVFLLCLALGIGCGVFFDFQRSIRKIFFAGVLRTTLEDILFVFLCIGAVLALGFFFNNGELRYYQILGCVSGALFYAAFLTRWVTKLFSLFYSITEKIIVKPFIKICTLALIPARSFCTVVKRLLKKLKAVCTKVLHALKNNLKMLKKRIKML